MKHLISLNPGRALSAALFVLVLTACAPAAAATLPPPQYNDVPQPTRENTATPPATATRAPTAAEQIPATGGATVQAADNPKLGKILVNANGLTLYTFEIDTPQESKCTASDCVTYWPPLTASAQPQGGPGVAAALATISRPDGAKQVTYDGKPLYTFIGDKNPGDATGDGFNQFGGVWHAATVSAAPSSSTPAASGAAPSDGPGGYHY
ncbi:MAG TPA: hypothetical protein VMT46_03995 [Anaerolineaceae bacterium]|nr:hypothetical protein [Anaerolineaceae bacterium]